MKIHARTSILKPKVVFFIVFLIFSNLSHAEDRVSNHEITHNPQVKKNIAYIVSDIEIPFWEIMSRGISNSAKKLGYDLVVYSSNNELKQELENTVKAIKNNVDGIIISPINSSSCVTILKLAKKYQIPVVISDIGTDKGEYVSYISSDNQTGAYKIGKILSNKMYELGFQEGSVGIIAIPQQRLNGQLRTTGFIQALNEAGIKGSDLKQQSNFSYEETYNFSKEMLIKHKNLRAIWLQGSNRYKAALDAIKDVNRNTETLLVTFDAEPEFMELIPRGVITGAAMQQPFLMGEKAIITMDKYLAGEPVKKNQQLEILAISKDNISKKQSIIMRNVLGVIQ